MLGQRIKKLRKERGATLKQVAEASGLSQGYLSQIETDKVEPSISVLRKLSSYYRVPLLYFFDTDPVEDIVVRRDERKIISSPRAPVTYEMLQHDVTNKKMECSIMKLAPHYSDPDGVYASYPGEECFLVLSGAVEFEQDGRVYTLNEGDSIYYESSKPFRLMNPGDVTAEIVGVRTPPNRRAESEE